MNTEVEIGRELIEKIQHSVSSIDLDCKLRTTDAKSNQRVSFCIQNRLNFFSNIEQSFGGKIEKKLNTGLLKLEAFAERPNVKQANGVLRMPQGSDWEIHTHLFYIRKERATG